MALMLNSIFIYFDWIKCKMGWYISVSLLCLASECVCVCVGQNKTETRISVWDILTYPTNFVLCYL